MNIALITGIGKGIGKALAEKFLLDGWTVVGTVREASTLMVQERLSGFVMDLSVPASIAECVRSITQSGKTFDVLINNAGALLDEEDTAVDVKKLRSTLEINLIGTIDFTEQVLPLIKEEGHIVNIASTAGSLSLASSATKSASHYPLHYPAYKISKAALNMYTRTLATRLEPRITVSSVHPGWVKTDMGGEDAAVTPQEAAEKIFGVATKKPPTGGFWFGDESVPW